MISGNQCGLFVDRTLRLVVSQVANSSGPATALGGR
jgi:hypothetical protein